CSSRRRRRRARHATPPKPGITFRVPALPGGRHARMCAGKMRSKKMIHAGIAAAALLSAATLAHAGETVRYVALVQGGTPAGQLVVTTGDDGVSNAEFVFKNNGRGPELTETYTLSADGTYETFAVKGNSTFGAPVEESFTLRDGHAIWKSLSD